MGIDLFVCFVLLGGGSLSKEIPQQNFLGNIGLHYKITSVTLVLQSDTSNIIVLCKIIIKSSYLPNPVLMVDKPVSTQLSKLSHHHVYPCEQTYECNTY